MKILRREIAIRRAAKRFLLKTNSSDTGRIGKLTAEIFELQRSMLTKFQAKGMLPMS